MYRTNQSNTKSAQVRTKIQPEESAGTDPMPPGPYQDKIRTKSWYMSWYESWYKSCATRTSNFYFRPGGTGPVQRPILKQHVQHLL